MRAAEPKFKSPKWRKAEEVVAMLAMFGTGTTQPRAIEKRLWAVPDAAPQRGGLRALKAGLPIP